MLSMDECMEATEVDSDRNFCGIASKHFRARNTDATYRDPSNKGPMQGPRLSGNGQNFAGYV